MADLVTFRSIKGAPLSYDEMDSNLGQFFVSASVFNDTVTFYRSGSDGSIISQSITLFDSDNQTLSINGQILSISDGNSVTLPDEDTTYTLASRENDGANELVLTDSDGVEQVITLSAGDNISILAEAGNIEITSTHPTIADAASDTSNTGRTYIQNLEFDSNGHVTNVTTGTETVTTHDAVTLAGSYDYITLDGQKITRKQIDLTTDVTGILPVGNMAATALTTIQVADDEAAMLALTAQEGDVVVRTDESKTYMHNGGTAGDITDFTLLATPTDAVTSVNGNTGAITVVEDKVVSIVGENIIVGGAYPNFELTASATYGDADVKDVLNAQGVISSSAQIEITESQISDLAHYTDADVKAKLNTEGVISSSAQVNADSVTNFDANVKAKMNADNVVSGSVVITETDPVFTSHTAYNIVDSLGTAFLVNDQGTWSYDANTYVVDGTLGLQGVCSVSSTTNTSITAANFITTSDKRLKSDIKPIQEGLDTLKKFVSYEYIKDGKQDAGFIAQEIQEAIPYAVQEGESGYLNMSDRPILAHMHKAILELEKRIADIETKLK